MCEPTTALIITSVASAGLQFSQTYQQQKAVAQQQRRQNDLARKNAIQRYANEQLKIQQVVDEGLEKKYQASLKSRKARATARNVFGEKNIALRGSAMSVYSDFYRVEGNYMASVDRNLNNNIDQYERNLEAIKFGAEAQSTYVTPPNPVLLFATESLNLANKYYGFKYAEQQRDDDLKMIEALKGV